MINNPPPITPPLTTKIKVVNWYGRASGLLGLTPAALIPERLINRAMKKSGLSDFGDEGFREGLQVLCDSLTEDADLSLLGRLFMRERILSALTTRLSLRKLELEQPEIFERPLNSPLIILGLPRTGTTMLHRLAASASGARHLKTWEVMFPLPPETGPDKRHHRIKERLRKTNIAAPSLSAKHFVSVDDAEECIFLMEPSLMSPSFWTVANCDSYLHWLMDQETSQSVSTYKKLLQIFQSQSPNKRLTLKAPALTPYIGELAAEIPSASLIQTHRKPEEVFVSLTSLFCTLKGLVTENLNVSEMNQTTERLVLESLQRNQQQRETIREGKIVDIRYTDLLEDPVKELKRAYKTFGFDWSEERQRELTEAHNHRPQHAHGRHIYSAETYNLNTDEIADKFAFYSDRYL
jgi:hypothetical protein